MSAEPDMTYDEPSMNQRTNINTWITLAGFGLTLVVNAMNYQAFKTETEVWRVTFVQQLEDEEKARSTALNRLDSRVEVVERDANSQRVAAATAAAQIAAVRDSLLELKASQLETNRLLRELTAELPPRTRP